MKQKSAFTFLLIAAIIFSCKRNDKHTAQIQRADTGIVYQLMHPKLKGFECGTSALIDSQMACVDTASFTTLLLHTDKRQVLK